MMYPFENVSTSQNSNILFYSFSKFMFVYLRINPFRAWDVVQIWPFHFITLSLGICMLWNILFITLGKEKDYIIGILQKFMKLLM